MSAWQMAYPLFFTVGLWKSQREVYGYDMEYPHPISHVCLCFLKLRKAFLTISNISENVLCCLLLQYFRCFELRCFCAFWNSIKVSAGSDIEFWHVYSPRLKYADISQKLNVCAFYFYLESGSFRFWYLTFSLDVLNLWRPKKIISPLTF